MDNPMPTLLAVTVGGSCQPVVTAIHDYAPAHVCFLASTGTRGSRALVDGSERPCQGTAREPMPAIVAQARLTPDRYTVHEIADPDSLQDCYAAARAVLAGLAARFPNHRCVADYTGGTKSMSVGLVMAALEADWEISLVKGARTDLVKVVDGTEVAGLVNSWEVRARQRMEEARRLFADYHFAAAEGLLEAILRSAPISTDLQAEIRQWIAFARGFDAWDRFDHTRAFQVLEPFQGRLVPHFIFLKRLLGKDRQATGYEGACDLLRNAERRAAQHRFDDAVARLYRAVELFAQVRLGQRTPPLASGDLDLDALPEHLRAKYEAMRDARDGKIRLGLRQDYDLLAELGDPAGTAYRRHEKRLLHVLTARNASILAHGTTPLTAAAYEEVANVVGEMLQEACSALKIRVAAPQLPLLRGSELVERD